MAIDLDAIKKRVAELSGVKRTSSVQMWKPDLGEHKIRCLPWKNTPDGQPFAERWFYYLGNEKGFLSPKQFGKPDPIDDLIRKLYSSGKPDDRLLAKKLAPKMRCYAPVVVRGQEDKGVLVWSFGKQVYQRMLGFFLDEDVGDILSPTTGFDLKVTITKAQGKQFNDTTVDPARKQSPLHADEEVSQKWLDSVPNIDDMYRLKNTQEIEAALNSWLNGGAQDETPAMTTTATTRGPAPADELDNLVADMKPAAKPAPKAEAKPAKKSNDLDAAFAELMDDA